MVYLLGHGIFNRVAVLFLAKSFLLGRVTFPPKKRCWVGSGRVGSGRELSNISRGESDQVRRCSKPDGPARVRSRRFLFSRVGSDHPDPTRAAESDPTRENPLSNIHPKHVAFHFPLSNPPRHFPISNPNPLVPLKPISPLFPRKSPSPSGERNDSGFFACTTKP